MSPKARVIIRTEASSAIGMGHFMRCFAIAEAARARGIPVIFLLNEIGDAVAGRLAEIGAEGRIVAGAMGYEADVMALHELKVSRDDWIIVDSYQATEGYIRMLSNSARVAVIDDLCALEAYDCDLIINPAQAAVTMPYGRKSRAKLLLGADYALIRNEFLQTPSSATKGSSVTVMFGGSDPAGLTAQVAERLVDPLPDTRIKLIAGPANVHTGVLTVLEQKFDHIHLHASPDSVADVLAGSDLVITAAGGSVGEVAAMALPALVLVVYDNQAAALQACPYPVIDARQGLPDDLASRVQDLMTDKILRDDIARKAHALVDGQGPKRIVEIMSHV